MPAPTTLTPAPTTSPPALTTSPPALYTSTFAPKTLMLTPIKTTLTLIISMLVLTFITSTPTPTLYMSAAIITTPTSTSQRPQVVSVEDDKKIDSELFSHGRFVGVFGIPNLPNTKKLSKAELKKKQLDKWLNYCFCCRLNVLWYEDVLNNLCNDLVRCLGILVRYFYICVYVCKTHRPCLENCRHLKIDQVDNIHNYF